MDSTLTKATLDPDPINQFTQWFEKAKQQETLDATAMTLATVNTNYEVSARIVLLKSYAHSTAKCNFSRRPQSEKYLPWCFES